MKEHLRSMPFGINDKLTNALEVSLLMIKNNGNDLS